MEKQKQQQTVIWNKVFLSLAPKSHGSLPLYRLVGNAFEDIWFNMICTQRSKDMWFAMKRDPQNRNDALDKPKRELAIVTSLTEWAAQQSTTQVATVV